LGNEEPRDWLTKLEYQHYLIFVVLSRIIPSKRSRSSHVYPKKEKDNEQKKRKRRKRRKNELGKPPIPNSNDNSIAKCYDIIPTGLIIKTQFLGFFFIVLLSFFARLLLLLFLWVLWRGMGGQGREWGWKWKRRFAGFQSSSRGCDVTAVSPDDRFRKYT